MGTYESVSFCEDCKLVFRNRAIKVEGDYKQVRKNITNVTAKAPCPECGKEITTLVDTGYWLKVS